MGEVERFYRQLVHNLAAKDPAGLHRPIVLCDIRDSIVPYRANRRALRLESSEEYELALMRFCAGEGKLARTEPDEVRAEFAAELLTSNPDLTLIHRHDQARVQLEPQALSRVLRPTADLTYAPPEQRRRAAHSRQSAPPSKKPNAQARRCVSCGGTLPAALAVKFCPHCGGTQALTSCPRCQAELEADWKHCVICGTVVNAR